MDERTLFGGRLLRMIQDNHITEKRVFRLAFMSVCGRNPQRAKELKDNCLKLNPQDSCYIFFEGYMTALCDEVIEHSERANGKDDHKWGEGQTLRALEQNK